VSAHAIEPWFAFRRRASPAARLRLFCFAHAGGSAAVYRPWVFGAADWLDVIPLEYSGRGTRLGEPLVCELRGIAQLAAAALQQHARAPFALFGHSMGGLVAFEVARMLEHDYGCYPRHVLVAAAGSPRTQPVSEPLHTRSDEALLQHLRLLGGLSDDVANDADLMRRALPIVRADLHALETYVSHDPQPIAASISAPAGSADASFKPSRLAAWSAFTRGAFCTSVFPGGHFFVNTSSALVLHRIHDTLAQS
jgi:medium-chain acyl-[acyl-carrier-protein] hydrolase